MSTAKASASKKAGENWFIKQTDAFFGLVGGGLKTFKAEHGFKWFWGFLIVTSITNFVMYNDLFYFTPFKWFNYLVLWNLITLPILAFIGWKKNRKLLKYQQALNLSGLKNVEGVLPTVVKAIALDDHRTKLLISATGIGLDEFSSKIGRLESVFKESVENISHSKDRKFVEIKLCTRELPSMIRYSEIGDWKGNPYSFVIGESLSGGLLDCEIQKLPHLLIGGTTGGGKSSFFKGTLLNLLKSSPHIQMYLIDLKRGVEVKEFSQLPNVHIAKDESEAVKMLSAIKDEMDKRYLLLEAKGVKSIDPVRDKKDIFVVGIDEASVLYGQTKSNKTKKEMMLQARDLTDELAKLARASGIHLIIATQKPIKESIDTKTLENLPGRLSFKMSTHAGSNSMLGNSKAYSLPDIKGRAIWKDGNKFLEVQTPFLTDEELDQEIAEIKTRFEAGEIKNLQPALALEEEVLADSDKLNALESKSSEE
jgi:hypothetical protein